MSYEAPRLIVHGSIETLTLAGSLPQGNDPCRFNKPRDTYKQTGASDMIQGNPNQNGLATCTPTSV